MISILRGSFDIILPCVLDAAGRCKLPAQMSGDMATRLKTLAISSALASLNKNTLKGYILSFIYVFSSALASFSKALKGLFFVV